MRLCDYAAVCLRGWAPVCGTCSTERMAEMGLPNMACSLPNVACCRTCSTERMAEMASATVGSHPHESSESNDWRHRSATAGILAAQRAVAASASWTIGSDAERRWAEISLEIAPMVASLAREESTCRISEGRCAILGRGRVPY
eukprot:1163703-Prymnesium_polylepis.1